MRKSRWKSIGGIKGGEVGMEGAGVGLRCTDNW